MIQIRSGCYSYTPTGDRWSGGRKATRLLLNVCAEQAISNQGRYEPDREEYIVRALGKTDFSFEVIERRKPKATYPPDALFSSAQD